jgi:hypothetical protein
MFSPPEDNVFIFMAPDANSSGNISVYSSPVRFKEGSPRYISMAFFCASADTGGDTDSARITLLGSFDLINWDTAFYSGTINFDAAQQTYFKTITPAGLFKYYIIEIVCTTYSTLYLVGSGF